jgi:peptidoglycan-associated lipoprotein
MVRKGVSVVILILCLGLILTGCPKKTVVKDEPSVQKTEEASAAAKEEKAKAEAERKAQEAKEREAIRIKEQEAKREQARREQEKRELERREQEKREQEKREQERREQEKRERERGELEKTLVARKSPGIEGEVYESSLLKDIRFDFDRYDIRVEDIQAMKDNAALLMKYPSVKIQIEGHCDERGTGEYNLALGERRANSAKRYLVSLGIAEGRISTISYGEENPVDPGHHEDAWAKNRRAHFIILSK